MPENKPIDAQPKVAVATNPTVAVDLAKLTQENAELKIERDSLKVERDMLQTQINEANTLIERDIREDLYTRILGKSNYTRAELEPRALAELQKLDADLSRGLGLASTGKGTFKPVSTAKDSLIAGSVPDLFGKDRATVLKELGSM